MKFFFVLLIIAQADLLSYNRHQNHLTRHLHERINRPTKQILPVDDINKMKSALKQLNKKNYKAAAKLMAKLRMAQFMQAKKPKATQRLNQYLAHVKKRQ